VDAGSGTLVFTAGGSDKTITIAAGASVHAEGGNATTPAITFNADNMNIAGTLDAGGPTGKDILLQAVSPHRNLHFAANNTADTGGELSFNQDELNNIHAHTLTIGNTAAGDINGIGTVSKPGTVEIFRVIGGSSSVSVQAFASQFASFLSGTALPTPRLEVTTFSGAAIDLDEASKIMEPNAIGTLFLQVPFVPVNEAKYRIEEGSKWTTGRIAASGTTAGPQTPR
jgi:hypothetical protein